MKFKKIICGLLIMGASYLSAEQMLVSNFNEEEYESVERIFANNTSYIDRLVDFVRMNVVSKEQSKKAFLDIGAGPGTIAERLSKFFTSITVIEPNSAFASIYQNKGFTSYIGNFQDIPLNCKYDAVLCSHVLYHVPCAEWTPFLKKMYDLIRPGGKGFVAMVAPKGKWHVLRSSLNSDYFNCSQVEKVLKEQNISYDLTFVQSIFNVQNYKDFRALTRLFTIEDCYFPDVYRVLSDLEKKKIDQKIEEYIATCKQPDGSYEFSDEDAYIILHKD
jgi:2-polyprenyl-3-methyl-5-hydroxy-6-metoxy-1,4-benzoquinol methylase